MKGGPTANPLASRLLVPDSWPLHNPGLSLHPSDWISPTACGLTVPARSDASVCTASVFIVYTGQWVCLDDSCASAAGKSADAGRGAQRDSSGRASRALTGPWAGSAFQNRTADGKVRKKLSRGPGFSKTSTHTPPHPAPVLRRNLFIPPTQPSPLQKQKAFSIQPAPQQKTVRRTCNPRTWQTEGKDGAPIPQQAPFPGHGRTHPRGSESPQRWRGPRVHATKPSGSVRPDGQGDTRTRPSGERQQGRPRSSARAGQHCLPFP